MRQRSWLETVLAHTEHFHAPVWKPHADVYRASWGWLVKFDLAGIRREDVSLKIDGRYLTVRGTRRDSVCEQGCYHYHLEINYSQFERTLEFPSDLDHTSTLTEMRDGMLLVRILTENAS